MKTQAGRRRIISFNWTVAIGIFLLAIAAMAIPLFSASSRSLDNGKAAAILPRVTPVRPETSQKWSNHVGGDFSNYEPFAALLPQQAPETIGTFHFQSGQPGNCTTTPQDQFTTGDTVCVRASGLTTQRKVYWVNPDDHVVQIDTVSPSNPEATRVVTQLGRWRVYLVDPSDGSARAVAVFTVSDPHNPAVDLSVIKTSGDGIFTAGGFARYTITVTNNGPDTATNVVLTEQTPNNTTLVAGTESSPNPVEASGPPFTCTPGNPTTCTASSMDAGTSATFTFVYTVNSDTPVGTVITNTATVASSTTELNPADNTSKASGTVVSSGGNPTSCTVTCPEDVSAGANTTQDPNDPNSPPGAVVHFSPPIGSDECGTITVNHCNDCFFPVGHTTVTATATTGDSCSFVVTVTPAQTGGTTISCPSNQTANADSNCKANVQVGTATATGTNVTLYASRSDGELVYNCDDFGNCTRTPSDAPFTYGVTTITWYAFSHDIPGPYNAQTGDEESRRTGSASCEQTVTVNDTTAPTIAATDSSASADANCQAPVPDYSSTVSDNCSSNISYTQTPAAGTLVGLGPHTVHIEANDNSSNNNGTGNASSKDVTFTVNDTTAPTITCPANQTANSEPGVCSAHVVTGTATATDNCDSHPTVTGTRSDGGQLTDPYPVGTTTITWTATDSAGNSASCTQTIRVEDHEDPTIVCPAPVVQGNDPGTCSATVNPGQPTAHDNCGTPTVTGTRSDGQPLSAPYPKGTTTITWTATDASGNHASCTQTVTVVDNEAPTFTFTGTQTMWPPNHKYHTFNMTDLVASVHDNCDGNIPVSSVVITKVTSDEIENGNGDGNTTNDIVIASNCRSVQLRSEREGNGNGRVYTIFFSVTDAAGNTGTGTTRVVVPHNPGETAVDSGPHYIVNSSNCPP